MAKPPAEPPTGPNPFDAAIAASKKKGITLKRPAPLRARDEADRFSTKPAPGPTGPRNEDMIRWVRKRRQEERAAGGKR